MEQNTLALRRQLHRTRSALRDLLMTLEPLPDAVEAVRELHEIDDALELIGDAVDDTLVQYLGRKLQAQAVQV